MDEQAFDALLEHALVALTYIECDQGADMTQVAANKKLILDTYGSKEVHEGAMFMLATVISCEAHLMNLSVPERITQLRNLVRNGIKPTNLG